MAFPDRYSWLLIFCCGSHYAVAARAGTVCFGGQGSLGPGAVEFVDVVLCSADLGQCWFMTVVFCDTLTVLVLQGT